MNKKLLILLIACALLPTVNAESTIDIKTLPNHSVQITLFNEVNDEFFLLDRLEKVSDENGEVSFALSVESDFNLMVFVKTAERTIFSRKYSEIYTPEEKVYLEIIPEIPGSRGPQIPIVPVLTIFVLIVMFYSFKKMRKRKVQPKQMEVISINEFMERIDEKILNKN